MQSDGKILVGGSNLGNGYIYRLNGDGSTDTSFAANGVLNGSVISIAEQSDGKILYCGNNNTDGYVVRLDSNGSTDTTFVMGTERFFHWTRSQRKALAEYSSGEMSPLSMAQVVEIWRG